MCRQAVKEKYISKGNIEFGVERIWTTNVGYVTFYQIWTGNLMDCNFELHFRCFTGVKLENTCTTTLNSNCSA